MRTENNQTLSTLSSKNQVEPGGVKGHTTQTALHKLQTVGGGGTEQTKPSQLPTEPEASDWPAMGPVLLL